ncbi:MAG TPA: DUF5630 domain-containing protein [Coxiellaceae bacterium]|nr:DUF5630 domain-containing protein [Coxiellaceae bacterium]
MRPSARLFTAPPPPPLPSPQKEVLNRFSSLLAAPSAQATVVQALQNFLEELLANMSREEEKGVLHFGTFIQLWVSLRLIPVYARTREELGAWLFSSEMNAWWRELLEHQHELSPGLARETALSPHHFLMSDGQERRLDRCYRHPFDILAGRYLFSTFLFLEDKDPVEAQEYLGLGAMFGDFESMDRLNLSHRMAIGTTAQLLPVETLQQYWGLAQKIGEIHPGAGHLLMAETAYTLAVYHYKFKQYEAALNSISLAITYAHMALRLASTCLLITHNATSTSHPSQTCALDAYNAHLGRDEKDDSPVEVRGIIEFYERQVPLEHKAVVSEATKRAELEATHFLALLHPAPKLSSGLTG